MAKEWLAVRLDKPVKDALRRQAVGEKRSLTNMIEVLILRNEYATKPADRRAKEGKQNG